jgi:hypothetical protein
VEASPDRFTNAEIAELGFESFAFWRATHYADLRVSGFREVGQAKHSKGLSVSGVLNSNGSAELGESKPNWAS